MTAFSGSSRRKPAGLANTFFFTTRGHGIPRRENLLGIRLLETTHAVQIPLRTVQSQVATTPWMIRTPEGVTETDKHIEAAAEVEAFLDGHFNQNKESFASLVKKWVGDILSIDSGILELVPGDASPGGGAWLGEIYSRDGITFTKAPDNHGRLPVPGSPDAAYWQFSLAGLTGAQFDSRDALYDVLREQMHTGFGYRAFKPIGFTRDQLVWTENQPRSWDEYGLGIVQTGKRIIEILLNQDMVNRKYFTHNEIPEGLLQFIEAQQGEIDRFREYWRENIVGREHKMAIVGGHAAQWLPFRPNLTDLQFLDSQAWYHKLFWFLFGLTPNEIGMVEDVNRANGEEQSLLVWRKTTKPLLDILAQELNRKILPFLKAYATVGGELEFAWDFDNPAIQQLRRSREKEDLELGLSTVNEVRKSRGLEELPWGGLDVEGTRSIWRSFPRWAMQTWLGIEEDELPEDPVGSLFGLDAEPSKVKLVRDVKTRPYLLGTPAADVKVVIKAEGGAGVQGKLAGIIEALTASIAGVLANLEDDVIRAVEEAGGAKGSPFDISRVVAEIDVAEALKRVVLAAAAAGMTESSRVHAERAARELQARLGEDAPDLAFEFDVTQTPAYRHLATQAAARMRTVNDTIKDLIRETLVHVVHEEGGTVGDATRALRDLFGDQLTESHARLVARTEVLSAGRHGSQAFAESSELIGGKGWRSTGDTRTRAWHAVMNGTEIPVDSTFTVPVVDPKKQRGQGYPKSVLVVGDDQPFNCRCDQYVVLAENLPATLEALASVPGVVRVHPPDYATASSDKQRGLLFAHGKAGEAFPMMMTRLRAEAGSIHGLSRRLGVPRSTVYEWLPDARE